MKIELTQQQVLALDQFLQRTSIQGSEAETMVVLRQTILKAVQEDSQKKPEVVLDEVAVSVDRKKEKIG